MENAAGVSAQVERFIRENFLVGAGARALHPNDSFLENGIVDSTGVLELVGFIEKAFGITMDDSELLPDNLDSVNRVVAFILRKKEQPCAGSAVPSP